MNITRVCTFAHLMAAFRLSSCVPVHIPLNASYNIEITGYSRAQPEAFKSACLKYSYASSNTKWLGGFKFGRKHRSLFQHDRRWRPCPGDLVQQSVEDLVGSSVGMALARS